MQKEIPILFSTPMVLAILARRKTKTRRSKGLEEYNITPDEFKIVPRDVPSGFQVFKKANTLGVEHFKTYWDDVACPYGKPGDILWVRENFRVNSWELDDGEVTFRYEADGAVSHPIGFDDEETFIRYWQQACDDLYKAGIKPNDKDRFEDYKYDALRLRPNIFLPKSAARIWLEVTDIRAERLQDISEEDAKAEGVRFTDFGKDRYNQQNRGWHVFDVTSHMQCLATPRTAFGNLWKKINGPESWNANPWVWVVSFHVLSTTAKPDLKNLKSIACQNS